MSSRSSWSKMRERLKRHNAAASIDDASNEPAATSPASFGRRSSAVPSSSHAGSRKKSANADVAADGEQAVMPAVSEQIADACLAGTEETSENSPSAATTPDETDAASAPPASPSSEAASPALTVIAPAPGESEENAAPPKSVAGNADDGLLGHVISVAGSVIWGQFEEESNLQVEIGSIVRLQGGFGRSFGIVTTLRRDGRRIEDDRRLVEIKVLGEVPDGAAGFQCGVSQHPALDSPIHLADQDELALIYRQPAMSTVRLGTLRQADGLPAYAVTDQLLGKHFAVLGTTGAGKSCAVTVILKAILESNPFGHIVMLDPHNEYGQAFGDRAELLNPTTLKLPYWLLNFEEISEVLVNKESAESAYAEAAILRDAILRARKLAFGEDKNSDHITVDTPTPYRLSDLIRVIKEEMGAFNRADQVASFQHLIARIERVGSDRRFSFMFSSFMVQDSMSQVLSSILRIPVAEKPVTIIDLSGMPSEIVDVVVSVLCRLIFDFALWTDRKKAPPILLVCEEAHRYVPRDDDTAFAPTKRAISRIAKEGRKYGLSLGLVTQRPAELSVSSLSQCNTIFALRMGNEHDLNFVQHAIPEGSRWLTETMPSLNTREAVVIGAGVSVPMHIRFDELAPEHRPASTTPPFSSAWQQDLDESDLVDRTILRWRHQMREDPVTD